MRLLKRDPRGPVIDEWFFQSAKLLHLSELLHVIGIITLLVIVVFCKSHGRMEKGNVGILGIENS
jgi:hypothetical protein